MIDDGVVLKLPSKNSVAELLNQTSVGIGDFMLSKLLGEQQVNVALRCSHSVE